MPDVRIGISGWTYAPWRGTFYPPRMPHREELPHVARHLRSVEVNGSFYALQRPTSYLDWRARTPEDFVFAVKGPRFITHMKQLLDVETPLANFLASGVLALGDKLGPLLWQLPPRMRFDRGRLEAFLDLLPRDTGEAAALAARCDAERMRDRSWTTTDAVRRLRHALEVRHESFRDPALVDLLRARGVALVVADTAGKWPLLREVTGDLVYVRLHGDEELYASGYSDEALDRWAEEVRGWTAQGCDVHVYFDNDVKVRAPYDAMGLAARLGAGPAPAPPTPEPEPER